MPTLETLYSQVEEQTNISGDDSIVSRDYIVDLIGQQRALWLRNESNKGRDIDPDLIQDLGCVPVEVVSSEQCVGLDIPQNCKILRSKCKIPNSIKVEGSKLLTRVGPIDMIKKSYNLVPYNRIPFTGHGRFAKNIIYTFLYNEYLYLYSEEQNFKLIQFINVRGVFEDPLAVQSFKSCTSNTSCYNVTTDNYPISAWLWEYIKPVIVDQILQKQFLPLDDSNNAKDDRTEIGKK